MTGLAVVGVKRGVTGSWRKFCQCVPKITLFESAALMIAVTRRALRHAPRDREAQRHRTATGDMAISSSAADVDREQHTLSCTSSTG
jgi:hypothetical protein